MSFIQSVNIGYSAQLSAIEYSAIGTITEFFSKDILRIYPTLRRYALVSLMYSFMQRLEKLMEEGACITDLKPSNLLVYGSPASRLNEFFNRIKGDIGAISLRKPEELLALLFDNLFELFLSDVKAVSGPEDHRSAKKALLSLMKKEMQITTTSIPKWLEEQEATDKNDDAALMAIMLYQLGLIFYIVATGKSEKEIADSLYHGKDFSSIFEYTSEMFQSECGQELQELCAMLLAVTPETASTTLKNSINILSMMQDKMAEMSDNKWIDEGSQRFKKEMAIQDLRTALLEFSELCSMYNFDDGFILDNINCIDEAKKDVANEASLLQMIFDGFDDFRENALEIVGVLAKKNAPPGIRNEFDDAMAEVIKTMAVVESYVNGPNNQFNNGSSEASSSSSGESSTFTVSPDKSADSSPTANGSSLRHGSVDTLIFSQSGFQYFQPANSATSSYSGLTSGSGSHSSEPASPRDSNSSSHNSPASGSPRMDGKSSSQSL